MSIASAARVCAPPKLAPSSAERWTESGPLLPESMQQQLFDSMVSVRESSERVHLGLGLHIVRRIVDLHQGSAQAQNLEDGSGVIFRWSFPLRA